MQHGHVQALLHPVEHRLGHPQHGLAVGRVAHGDEHAEDALRLCLLDFFHLLRAFVYLLDERQGGCGDEGGDHRHDDEHHVDGLRQDAHLVADVEHDELHQPARVHEDAHGEAVLRRLARGLGGERAAHELAHDGRERDESAYGPQVRRVEQPDFGVQPRVDEEQRKQQRDGQVLDALYHHLPELGEGRHDDPGQERAEEGVYADELRDEGRPDDDEHEEGEHALVHHLHVGIYGADALEEGLHHQQHDHHVGHGAQDGVEGADEAARLRDGDDGGQQAPRRDVARGRAGDGHGAEVRLGKLLLLHDACQYGECRDAHGNADEEREGEERGVPGGELLVDEV